MYDQAQSLRNMVEKERPNSPPSLTPKVITITSGKGGVGKSTVSVNLAIALSQLGLRVLLIDADFGLANIDVMLGVPAQYNLSHFLRKERTLAEIIQEGHHGVRFISGGSGIAELLNMREEEMAELLDHLLSFSVPNDIILIDTSAGITETVLRLAQASSECVIITTPEPTAILDAYALLKTLGKGAIMPDIRLIMNKAESQKEAENATQSFVRIASKYLNLYIEPVGSILYDNEIPRSIRQQQPVLLGNPKSAAARDIFAIAEALLHLPASTPKATGPLSRLFMRVLGQK